jgi:hypothetical protein
MIRQGHSRLLVLLDQGGAGRRCGHRPVGEGNAEYRRLLRLTTWWATAAATDHLCSTTAAGEVAACFTHLAVDWVVLRQDGPKVVVGHIDHDSPTGCVGASVAHSTLCGERLSRA